MATLIDLIGNSYGNLTVVERDTSRKTGVWWRCKCSCGGRITVSGEKLRNWKVYSCGCVHPDKIPWNGVNYRSKYEVFCAMYLTSHNIRFKFEPAMYRVAGMHRGRMKTANYLPDFYLVDKDLWWEVKGRPSRMWKFEGFARFHDAELVEKDRIEQLCGCSLSKLYRVWKKGGMQECYEVIAASSESL